MALCSDNSEMFPILYSNTLYRIAIFLADMYYPRCRCWRHWHWQDVLCYSKDFLFDGQGTVRQAILYANRFYWLACSNGQEDLLHCFLPIST